MGQHMGLAAFSPELPNACFVIGRCHSLQTSHPGRDPHLSLVMHAGRWQLDLARECSPTAQRRPGLKPAARRPHPSPWITRRKMGLIKTS